MASPCISQTFWQRFAKEPLLVTPFFWPWRAFFAFNLDSGEGRMRSLIRSRAPSRRNCQNPDFAWAVCGRGEGQTTDRDDRKVLSRHSDKRSAR